MFFNPYKIRNITIPRDYFRHHFPLNSDKMTRLISEWILVNQIQCTPTNPNPLYTSFDRYESKTSCKSVKNCKTLPFGDIYKATIPLVE